MYLTQTYISSCFQAAAAAADEAAADAEEEAAAAEADAEEEVTVDEGKKLASMAVDGLLYIYMYMCIYSHLCI